jgi:F0F1-type ATP synthase assembly protein I
MHLRVLLYRHTEREKQKTNTKKSNTKQEEKIMTNTNTNITKAANEEKKARVIKFFIFLAIFVGACTVLGIVIPLAASKTITFGAILHGFISDTIIGSIIGYFVFLRKKKSKKTEAAA